MGLESLLASQIIGLAEAVDDEVATLLVAGTGITLTYNDGANTLTIASSGGIGGSTGATDNRILRSDGTGGATVQNSAVTIDDSGNISGLGTVNSEGQLTVRRVGGTAGTHEVQIYHDTNGGWVAESSSTRLNLVSSGSIIFGVNPGAPTNTGYGSISGSAFRVTSSIAIGWLSGSDPIGGSVDTALRRSSAGVVEINNGTAGTLRDLSCRAITASGAGGQVINIVRAGLTSFGLGDKNGDSFRIYNNNTNTDLFVINATSRLVECGAIVSSALVTVGTYTVATLPAAAANAGALAQVTDSSVTTNGSAVSGSGSNRVVVFSNGSTWDVVVA